MISRKYSKQKCVMIDGPYRGRVLYLSESKHLTTSTFVFKVNGVVGQYVNRRWVEFDTDFKVNDNVVLGEN